MIFYNINILITVILSLVVNIIIILYLNIKLVQFIIPHIEGMK